MGGISSSPGVPLTRQLIAGSNVTVNGSASATLAGDVTIAASGGGGGGGSSVGSSGFTNLGSSGTAFGTGFAGLVCISVAPGATITGVSFVADSASPTTGYNVCLYSDANLAAANLLSDGAGATGVVKGLNSMALDTPYTNASAAPVLVWVGIVITVANISLRKGSEYQVSYFGLGSFAFPAIAPGQSFDSTYRWQIFAY